MGHRDAYVVDLDQALSPGGNGDRQGRRATDPSLVLQDYVKDKQAAGVARKESVPSASRRTSKSVAALEEAAARWGKKKGSVLSFHNLRWEQPRERLPAACGTPCLVLPEPLPCVFVALRALW